MGKFGALWALFQAGNAVADPALWKKRQIGVTAVAAVIVALVRVVESFGYRLPLSHDGADAIAGAVVVIVNVVLTVTTTEKLGVGRAVPVQPEREAPPGPAQAGGVADPGGGA